MGGKNSRCRSCFKNFRIILLVNFMGIQKLRIALKAYETSLLNDSCTQIINAVETGGVKAIGPIPLPTKRRIYCVLRSPHVNKDAREHFEMRTHKKKKKKKKSTRVDTTA